MHELPKLPYDFNALEPHIDEETMKIHHGKHHQAYVDKLNAAVKGTEFEINYAVISGEISEIRVNSEAQSIIVTISSDSKGGLGILLPREVIDAKLGDNDSDFFVLADGIEIDYKEKIDSESRLLSIVYPAGTEKIEIIGTFVIPEFASFAMLILLFSISGMVFASRKLKI